MPDSTPSHPSDLAAALGRVPSGLYILTVRNGDQSTGMLASWVQQAGFSPPMLTVAIHKERYVAAWIRTSGKFVLNQVGSGNKTFLRHFGKGFAPEDDAFEGIRLAKADEPAGPVLAEALSYLVVEPSGEVEGGDHIVMLGTIVDGAVLDEEGTPLVHIRRNGLHY